MPNDDEGRSLMEQMTRTTAKPARIILPISALLTANVISQLGNVLTYLAIPWFVLTTTGSASRAGITAAVGALPVTIAGIFGGAVVDRDGRSWSEEPASMGVVGTITVLLHFRSERCQQCLGEHDCEAGVLADLRHVHQVTSIEAAEIVHLGESGGSDDRRVLELSVGRGSDHVGAARVNHAQGEGSDEPLKKCHSGRRLLRQVTLRLLLYEGADDELDLILKTRVHERAGRAAGRSTRAEEDA